jgi:transposase-like protein
MFGVLLRGVSTRQYRALLPQMAQTVGVSKSAVSREAIEASTAQLTTLLERRWDDVDLLVIYIDGQQHGEHHVISAVGVDSSGKKHVLGLQEGATENATAAKALLIDLREHGVETEKHFRRIQGYHDQWVLAAALGRANKSVTPQEKVA